MSRLFGEMRQIAFVVRDLDKALRYWTETMGVGPFYLFKNFVPTDYLYRGKPAPAPHVTLALGFSGEMQIELIQQHDDHPSAYRDFLLAGHEGCQHVSSWTTRAEYDQTYQAARARGVQPAHEGVVPGSNIRFVYFATDSAPGGLLYEMADLKETPLYDTMMKIRDEARRWDGTNPIRELSFT
ncbi:MAG: VOC family protein [Deltaproteobacteria bacterium]|nr:VOC family protein [Deltaproteobacteria bacterium]